MQKPGDGVSRQPVRYVALLRGVNVGGKNPVPMADLRACFEGMGFSDVRTYIQSGNVLFASAEPDRAAMTSRIEEALSQAFTYRSVVVVRSHDEVKAVVERAPEGFGSDAAAYLYDVVFLKPPLTADEAMGSVETREGVDRAFAGEGVLYMERLRSRATQSRLNRIASVPAYQFMTIRNWNTTTKLLGLMEPERPSVSHVTSG
jgi:uncharacterized protein (DUF1697 family)